MAFSHIKGPETEIFAARVFLNQVRNESFSREYLANFKHLNFKFTLLASSIEVKKFRFLLIPEMQPLEISYPFTIESLLQF